MTGVVRRETRRTLPDLFDWAEGLPNLLSLPVHPAMRGMRLEEYVDDGTYVVKAELPGIDPEHDVVVKVRDGMLSITAERKEEKHGDGHTEFHYGTLTRRVALPDGADESAVKARYESGILEVTVPFSTEPPAMHEVPIEHVK